MNSVDLCTEQESHNKTMQEDTVKQRLQVKQHFSMLEILSFLNFPCTAFMFMTNHDTDN